MPTVFISYRREDSGPFAARLFDRLCEHFGDSHVFRDVDGIEPGDDFAKLINERIAASDAVLVVIGPRWLTITDDKGKRRLDQPKDFVVAEIRAALAGGKRIIPVLVDGAKVPPEKSLPAAIRSMLRHNAAELSDSRFGFDVERVVEAIESSGGLRRWWDRPLRLLRDARGQRRGAMIVSALGALAGVAALLYTLLGPPKLAPLEMDSPEQVQAFLVDKRSRIDAELRATPAHQTELHALLDSERRGIERRLADLARTTERHNEQRQRVDDQLAAQNDADARAAREALRRSDSSPARERLTQTADGPDAVKAAAAAFQLGELAYADADYRNALPRLKQAARLQPGNADYLTAAGRLAQELGDLDQARRDLDTALAIRRQAQTPGDASLIDSFVNLALVNKDMRRHADAEALYLEALDSLAGANPPDAARVALVKNNLAQLYRAAAPDTAEMRTKIEALLRDSLALTRQAHGAESLPTATAMNNQAAFYAASGATGTAQPLYESALALREKLLPADHPDIAASLNNLAALHAGDGRPEQAVPLYLRALEIQRRAFGAEHRSVATTLNNLGQAYHRLGRPADAETSYRRALAIQGTAEWTDVVAVALTRNNLALIYLDQQRAAEAEPLLKDAATTLLAELPAQHEQVKRVVGNYIECLLRLNRDADATAWRQRLGAASAAPSS